MGFESSLETLTVIFQNVSPKGFFWLILKNFEILVLTDSRSEWIHTHKFTVDYKIYINVI